jgi:hypothetical protein
VTVLLFLVGWFGLAGVACFLYGVFASQPEECSLCGTDELLYPSEAEEPLICRRCRLAQHAAQGGDRAA